MIDRFTDFFTPLDRITAGADIRTSVVDPNQIRGGEVTLAAMAGRALRAVGIEHRSVHIDWDFEQTGATSVVRKIYARTGGSRRRHPSTPYAMRIQIGANVGGITDEYAPVADLARTIAHSAGLNTPRIRATQLDAELDGPTFTFTIEDFAEGINGFEFCRDNPDEQSEVMRAVGAALPLLHQIRVKSFGYFDPDEAKQGKLVGMHHTYRSHVAVGAGRALSRLKKADQINRDQAGALYKYFLEAPIFDRVNEGGPVLLHGDLGLYNLRVPEDRNPFIIDFGETRGGPPAHDLAYMSLDLARDGWENETEHLLAGYETTAGQLPDRIEESMTAIRLRLLVSVVAGQLAFIGINPGNASTRPFLSRAIQAFRNDAAALGVIAAHEFPTLNQPPTT